MAESILFEGDTELEHYQVVDTIYEGRQGRVLYSGSNSRTAQSGVAQDDQQDLLFDYNQRFVELLETVSAKQLLLIGGGAFTLPQALLVKFPDLQITVVEIDPGLQPIAEKYFGLQPSPRLNIINDDGDTFLRRNTQVYDVILLDVYSQSSIPEDFVSSDIVQLVYDQLTLNGVAAMNVISPFRGPSNTVIKNLTNLYRSVFRTVDIYPAGRALFSLWLPQNLVLVAQKGKPHELHLRYGSLTN